MDGHDQSIMQLCIPVPPTVDMVTTASLSRTPADDVI
jgi:hypothetical protein